MLFAMAEELCVKNLEESINIDNISDDFNRYWESDLTSDTESNSSVDPESISNEFDFYHKSDFDLASESGFINFPESDIDPESDSAVEIDSELNMPVLLDFKEAPASAADLEDGFDQGFHALFLKTVEFAETTMKSPRPAPDDSDDIFGPPRTYPTGYNPPKTRPSMISAKYRQKEERRKVLKISMNKLKKIEDPEASLCRSVLINNTMRRLQKEARDEKIQKQQLNYPRCYENDNFLNIKSEFMKNESKTFEQPQDKMMEFVENDFDTKLAEEIETVNAKNLEVLHNFVEENSSLELNFATPLSTDELTSTLSNSSTNDRFSSRKRSLDDMDDCDVQDVLSQFYMPPTPRMLTCIDDDEDVNVVDDEPVPKRAKIEDCDSGYTPKECDYDTNKPCEDFSNSANTFINNNNISNNDSRLRYSSQNDDLNSFSCGQASMFNELQNNVYHNLIASLET